MRLRRRALLVAVSALLLPLVTALSRGGATPSSAGVAASRILFIRTGTHSDPDEGDIYVTDADGLRERNLTHDPAFYSGAVWSPDGRRIAFEGQKRVGPTRDVWATNIYVMDADGTRLRQLTRTPWNDHPVWSPDGRRIAFLRHFAHTPGTSSDHLAEIYVINADGSAKRRLTRDRLEESALAWSRNNKLAFIRAPELEPEAQTGAEIVTMNPDGSGKRQLTHNHAEEAALAWSPDGHKLAFASRRYSSSPSLHVMNADGTEVRRLLPSKRAYVVSNWPDVPAPVWSPDGSRIALMTTPARQDWTEEIYVLKSDGAALHKVVGNDPGWPTWSPDSRRIAFDRYPAIYVVNRDGSGQHRLVPRPGRPAFSLRENWGPLWQPRPT